MDIAIFWFRRDLRLFDNTALGKALLSGWPVLPVFIFDTNILDELPQDDARVSFIYTQLQKIHRELCDRGSSLLCFKGDPLAIWKKLIQEHTVRAVYFNKDYEPYARERDRLVRELLREDGIQCHGYKDQVIFEENDILKQDGLPYTVYTPYKNRWLERFDPGMTGINRDVPLKNFMKCTRPFPSLAELGFSLSPVKVKDYNTEVLDEYTDTRDFPGQGSTSFLGPHLRFGTLSIRWLVSQLKNSHAVFLGELIWREFFMQILFQFPDVVDHNFRSKYDRIIWRNDETEFEKWCRGQTGFPIVDAGMRELNETGYMHNRVRMITASFLCKHLLIDWRWGEAYFAGKLLDYELSSNNGNWQWAAGTGCDASPWFRIFNPGEQQRKFDRDLLYIKKWIPGFGSTSYLSPMVDHKFARTRAIERYTEALKG